MNNRQPKRKPLPRGLWKECVELWIHGMTLTAISDRFSLQLEGLLKRMIRFSKKSEKELRTLRLQNKAQEIYGQLLPEARATGYMPKYGLLRDICGHKKFIVDFIVGKMEEEGIRKPSGRSRHLRPGMEEKIVQLYTEGNSLKKITGSLRLSVFQVNWVLNEFEKQHPRLLSKQREINLEEKTKKMNALALSLARALNRMPSIAEMSELIPPGARPRAIIYLKQMGFEKESKDASRRKNNNPEKNFLAPSSPLVKGMEEEINEMGLLLAFYIPFSYGLV